MVLAANEIIDGLDSFASLEGSIIFREYYYLKPDTAKDSSEDLADGIFLCSEDFSQNYASYSLMPLIGTPAGVSDFVDCHSFHEDAFVSYYTNIPIQLEWTWFSAGNGERPFYSCNTKYRRPHGCDTVDHGIMFVVNERGEIERFDGAGYFDAYMAGRISYEEAEAYHVTIPIKVSESDVLACGDESVRQSIEMALYYEGDYVSSFIYAEGSYSSLAEALFLCKNLGIYYKKNHTLEGFALYSSSSVNSSSAFAPNIPVSSSESTSSSSVETSSSAVSSSSVQSNSSVLASSSSAENRCVAHSMNSVPNAPKIGNASRSVSECAFEWLWASPR